MHVPDDRIVSFDLIRSHRYVGGWRPTIHRSAAHTSTTPAAAFQIRRGRLVKSTVELWFRPNSEVDHNHHHRQRQPARNIAHRLRVNLLAYYNNDSVRIGCHCQRD